MSILGAVIVPHPPLIIPTVGRRREREVQANIDAYRTATKLLWLPSGINISQFGTQHLHLHFISQAHLL